MFERIVIAAHITGNLVWIGSILAVGLLLSAKKFNLKDRAALARAVYTHLSAPAFMLSLLAGTYQLSTNLRFYFKDTHFMHAKLPIVIGIIALHHIIGGKAKKAAAGEIEEVGKTMLMAKILLLCAIVTTFLVELKPF